MKTISYTPILVLLLASSVLTVPVPTENADETFAVKEINNTSVCVIKRVVYQDAELLPSENPCEICRCRPPGIACSLIQCSAKEAKPNCNLVKVKGQCCPQYQCEQKPTEVASSPEVTEPPQSSEVEARHDPTEPPQATEEPPSGELEQRAADGAGTSQAPPKGEPKSVDEEGTTAAPELPREVRLAPAATEEAQAAEATEAPLEAKQAVEPTEVPERESKSDGATSAGAAVADEPTAAPEKSERKDDEPPQGSTEPPKGEEQGRSADVVTAASQNEPERETKSVGDEQEATEATSEVVPRSGVQEPPNSGEGASRENSKESTEPPKPERKRRQEPEEKGEEDGEQTEPPTAAPEAQQQPEATQSAETEEPEKRPTTSE